MRLLTVLALRFRSLFAARHVDSELDEELRYHLEREIDVGIAAGLSPEEARHQALRTIGDFEQRKDACRDTRGLNWWTTFLQDTRFSVRQFRRSPGFALVSIAMLALALCATLAIFTFVDAALLKPLPYRDPAALVFVAESIPTIPRTDISFLDYRDWKARNTVFQSFDLYQRNGVLLSSSEGLLAAQAARVTDGFFRSLGVRPTLGRDFFPGEDQPAAARTVLLSHRAWITRYGGKPDIVGHTVTLNGDPYEIVGVLPASFHFAPVGAVDFWTTVRPASECDLRRSCHSFWGVARLKSGVSPAAALANISAIAKQLEHEYPSSNLNQGASITPLSEFIVGDVRSILLTLLGGAALLLLIATVNISSLLLLRSEGRRREFAVRRALGASTSRVLRQFAAESVLLVAAGSALGFLLAFWVIRILYSLIPEGMISRLTFLQGLTLSNHVVVAGLAITAFVAIVFTLAPARHAVPQASAEGLNEGSRGSSGLTWRRIGSKLVVLELATAVVLLVGAGLLGKSLYRLLSVDTGFRTDHLMTIEINAPPNRYRTAEQFVALQHDIDSTLRAIPGVQQTSVADILPLTFNGNTDWVRFLGRPFHGEHNEVNERHIGVGHFATLGAKLLRGREFQESDNLTTPKVAIINETFARQFYPGEDPIGKQFANDDLNPKSVRTIVGIVADIRDGSLDSPIWPSEYLPFAQYPDSGFVAILRTSVDENALVPTVFSTLRKRYGGLLIFPGFTVAQQVHDSQVTYLHRSAAWLVSGFGFVALLLSVIGLYGVVAYSVSQRTREIGVRMALGAAHHSVSRMILKEAAVLSVFGLALGLGASLLYSRLLRDLLFHTEAWDAPVLLAVIATLGVAALLASFVPARRAANTNPLEALRAE